ncbi:hypothetical protein VKT23_011593 [Stygiomarasmius scandens]|uniref:Aminoglycoside phosphotransferase domain-containing protein n=1 Tax=Marasmiellus scandens TaxID=2682957 RepID=A0ABR1J973_9AGAR
MTMVPGTSLGKLGVTVDDMSPAQKDVFVDTLRDWFLQLRHLPPPEPHKVSGFSGGGVYSPRIRDAETVGPFASIEDFHAQPFCTPWEPHSAELREALAKRNSNQYKICLTHGDITPTNILVDESLKPSGLVDWECASWMPEYWEYTRSLWLRQRYTGWCDLLTRIFPGYSSEKAIWLNHTP